MLELTDYSRTVNTDPVQVHPALHHMLHPGTEHTVAGLSHLRVWNVGRAGAPTVWLSRSGTARAGEPGSFPLHPGEKEEFHGLAIPLEALSAVADADGAALTVELRHGPRTAHRTF